jgi:hypothetical protein
MEGKGLGCMRNALYILLAAGVSTGAVAAQAASVETPVSSSASLSVPVAANGDISMDAPFLPVRGRDLPLSTAVTSAGSPQSVPQASVVEAIPTPTAFQAGGVLLLGLAAARSFRKLRIA